MMMFELPGELGFECYERQRDLAAAGMKVCEARAKAYYAVLGKEDPICPAGCFGRKV